jgi:hypothetical protein
MLYKCLECDHEISVDAGRCPNCGAEDAGLRARSRAWELEACTKQAERDQKEPGWQEREAREVRREVRRSGVHMGVAGIVSGAAGATRAWRGAKGSVGVEIVEGMLIWGALGIIIGGLLLVALHRMKRWMRGGSN